MTKVRVVAIKCPSCKGTLKGFLGLCMWCEGAGKIDRDTALRWAIQSFVLGSGGYVCGDHSYEDGEVMKNEANAVRKLLGEEPLRCG